MTSTEEMIGRAEIDDIEAILSVTNTDVDAVEHVVKNHADTIFTWDYTLARPALRKLYEKAKTGQWNATTDLPWDTEVDLEAVIKADEAAIGIGMDPTMYVGTPVEWGRGRSIVGHGGPALEPQPVHARRAGAAVHGQDRRDRALVRRQGTASTQVVNRTPASRCSPATSTRRPPAPDQRPPADAPGRHRQRQPLGHDLPRHAGDGGGAGPRRVRLHAQLHRRAAPQADAALRHERRGPSRGLRRAQPEGGLRGG